MLSGADFTSEPDQAVAFWRWINGQASKRFIFRNVSDGCILVRHQGRPPGGRFGMRTFKETSSSRRQCDCFQAHSRQFAGALTLSLAKDIRVMRHHILMMISAINVNCVYVETGSRLLDGTFIAAFAFTCPGQPNSSHPPSRKSTIMQHHALSSTADPLSCSLLLSSVTRKLGSPFACLPVDVDLLQSLELRQSVYERDTDMVDASQATGKVYVLTSGWVCSYKILRNGARQIIDFKLPGDIIGLQNLFLARHDLFFAAVTRVEVAECNGKDLSEIMHKSDRLANCMLRVALQEEASVVEHLVCLDRGSALECTAHFFLKLARRLEQLGMGTRSEFECPLTQALISDQLGLTPVHLNRVLRTLRERNLLTFQRGKMAILDYERLAELADYDCAYLH